MSKVVLDASAVLAILNREPGSEKLTPKILSEAVCSVINLAEAHTKLVLRGGDVDEAWQDVLSTVHEAIPFTPVQARLVGTLAAQTRSHGLSLGDRACLALGMLLKAPIYTSDREWKKLKLGVRIHVIR